MSAQKKDVQTRPKLVARPQRDIDLKAAREELSKRYSKTLEYLAR